MSAVGERIRKSRQERGYTQERLAREADISAGFVSELEKGNRNVSAENLLRIAHALQVSLDYLMKGEPTPAPGTFPKSVQFPVSFAEFARKERLPFDVACAIFEAKLQFIANRRDSGDEDLEAFDWKGFYDAVKDYL